jgi:hypothetical protein
MDTLPRETREAFFESAEHYQQFRQHWSWLQNSPDRPRHLGPEHHLLVAALRGRDWRKGFRPPTNEKKLANGAGDGCGARRALFVIRWSKRPLLLAPFNGLVTAAMLDKLTPFLKNPYGYTRLSPTHLINNPWQDIFKEAFIEEPEADPDVIESDDKSLLTE